MARQRMVQPSFWTDEALSECSLNARLLFIGTWNFADDEGNLIRSAKQIKAQVFPYDNIDCEPLIIELINHGLLIEYLVSGKYYLNVKNFKKHQIINRPSKPQCPLFEDSLRTHPEVNKEVKEVSNTSATKVACITKTENTEKQELEKNPLYTKQFLSFWGMYPNRKNKGDAAKAFSKIDSEEHASIRKGLEAAIASPDWKKNNGQFIPHPGTWLRARGWEDEYQTTAKSDRVAEIIAKYPQGTMPAKMELEDRRELLKLHAERMAA